MAAILLGVFTTGIVVFIYQNYRFEKDESSTEQKIAILNTKVISLGSALKPGVYKIEGYFSALSFQPDYLGEVVIAKSGPVYILESRWQDDEVKLRGIGILEGDILSVGFADVTYRDILDIGVFSYRVIEEDKLEGRWSTFSASVWGLRETGREVLTWQSELSEAVSISRPFAEYFSPDLPEKGVCGPYPDEVVTGSLTGGPVWGSQPYTDDSDFNRAAVHLGLISSGQTATIKKTSVGYLYDFPGSTQNGVTTFSWTTGWCGVEISLAE